MSKIKMTAYHNVKFTERELILVSELIDSVEGMTGGSEERIEGDMDTDFDTQAIKSIKAFKTAIKRSRLKVN